MIPGTSRDRLDGVDGTPDVSAQKGSGCDVAVDLATQPTEFRKLDQCAMAGR